jgi:protein-S-isoprenylcysteine O-methyltransferase Ste14
MLFDAIYTIIALLCTAIFLPLPVFWLIFHRNISHFRRHSQHVFLLLSALLILSGVFAWSNLEEIHIIWQTDIIMKIVGAVLLAAAACITYLAGRGFERKTLLGLDELESKNQLTDSSVYAHIRHPRYLTIFMFLFALFLITGLVAILYLFVYSIIMFHAVAKEEEKELKARLGKKYEDYAKRTGKFIPKLRKHGTKTQEKIVHKPMKKKPKLRKKSYRK